MPRDNMTNRHNEPVRQSGSTPVLVEEGSLAREEPLNVCLRMEQFAAYAQRSRGIARAIYAEEARRVRREEQRMIQQSVAQIAAGVA